MIFITLGSQKFQFNRLLKKIDELIETGTITDTVFAQTGYSDYCPKNFSYENFLDRDTFAAKTQESTLVITHGGTGAIIGAVKKGKKVIAVPRLAQYGEHVDDHQIQMIEQFNEMDIICACMDTEQLAESIHFTEAHNFRPYQSNTHNIIASITEYLETL
ncbi:MAG: beta(1,3)galactosyltransferase EpsH [Lachnospiraceae bacterium]|nr:beta(1,3)galactosyltransferase EpsH [Lachnospiraceae bacterium]